MHKGCRYVCTYVGMYNIHTRKLPESQLICMHTHRHTYSTLCPYYINLPTTILNTEPLHVHKPPPTTILNTCVLTPQHSNSRISKTCTHTNRAMNADEEHTLEMSAALVRNWHRKTAPTVQPLLSTPPPSHASPYSARYNRDSYNWLHMQRPIS